MNDITTFTILYICGNNVSLYKIEIKKLKEDMEMLKIPGVNLLKKKSTETYGKPFSMKLYSQFLCLGRFI